MSVGHFGTYYIQSLKPRKVCFSIFFSCIGNTLDLISSQNGATPLHLASKYGHAELVRYLCSAGCDVNAETENGFTADEVAANSGHDELATLIHRLRQVHTVWCDVIQLVTICQMGPYLSRIANKCPSSPILFLVRSRFRQTVMKEQWGEQWQLGTTWVIPSPIGHPLPMLDNTRGYPPFLLPGVMYTRTYIILAPHSTEVSRYSSPYAQDGGYLRDCYVSELVMGQIPLNRMKLLVCGAAGAGKSELIDSLRCHFLRSLFRRRSASNLTQMLLKRTHGMTVQQANIPNVGEVSICDFSGMKEYYMAHEHFLDTNNAVVLVVFSLTEPIERQVAQVRFWLAMIKSKQAPSEVIRYAGRGLLRPFVILIGSFVDQQRPPGLQERDSGDVFAAPLASSMEQPLDNGKAVLKTMVDEFGDDFVFPDTVYTLDCRLSQTREIRALRSLLSTLRMQVLKVCDSSSVCVCVCVCGVTVCVHACVCVYPHSQTVSNKNWATCVCASFLTKPLYDTVIKFCTSFHSCVLLVSQNSLDPY